MSYSNSTIGLSAIQEQLEKEDYESLSEKYAVTTFNITPELWQEMRAFSTDSRRRFLYVITHHNPDGSFNMGYSGQKTADTLSQANTYPGSSSDSLFSKKRILSHRSEYQMHVVGYCRNKEELGDSENTLNRYMKGFYKDKWANKHLGNGKSNIEGLIPIIKKGKKIKYVRPEELEHYKSLGWSRGMMLYKMRKEGEALQEVGEEQVRSLLESGYFFEGHESIRLHHSKVKGSMITVQKETGFLEEDVLSAFKEDFILGCAPEGHQTTADEEMKAQVRAYIVSFRKRWRQRVGDAKRDNTRYILKRGGDILDDVTNEHLIPLLKEGWKITSHEYIKLHHANVAGSMIQVTGVYMEEDILEAVTLWGFEMGYAPVGHQTTADEGTVKKVKAYIVSFRKRGDKRRADTMRASIRYPLKKGGETLDNVTRYDVLGKLKEDYRFTQGSVQICNKAGTVKPYLFEHPRMQATREERHLKLIGLLESGDWQMGMKWEEPMVAVIEEPEEYDFVGLMSLIEGL
jgi:hypothetical protein